MPLSNSRRRILLLSFVRDKYGDEFDAVKERTSIVPFQVRRFAVYLPPLLNFFAACKVSRMQSVRESSSVHVATRVLDPPCLVFIV